MSKKSLVEKEFLGKYVIVRSRNEGVNAGILVAADETGVILKQARRLHYHKPLDDSLSWYEGVAKSGLHAESRVSSACKKAIIEDYSVIKVSEKAEKSIREHPTNEQS